MIRIATFIFISISFCSAYTNVEDLKRCICQNNEINQLRSIRNFSIILSNAGFINSLEVLRYKICSLDTLNYEVYNLKDRYEREKADLEELRDRKREKKRAVEELNYKISTMNSQIRINPSSSNGNQIVMFGNSPEEILKLKRDKLQKEEGELRTIEYKISNKEWQFNSTKRDFEQKQNKLNQLNRLLNELIQQLNIDSKELPCTQYNYGGSARKSSIIKNKTINSGGVKTKAISKTKKTQKTKIGNLGRISSTQLKKIYSKHYGVYPKGFQIHHIIPISVAKQFSVIMQFAKKYGYDINNPYNLTALPSTQKARLDSNVKLPLHKGNHREYNALVKDYLQGLTNRYTKNGKIKKNIDSDKFLKELRDVEVKLRKNITNLNIHIKNDYVKKGKEIKKSPNRDRIKINPNKQQQKVDKWLEEYKAKMRERMNR